MPVIRKGEIVIAPLELTGLTKVFPTPSGPFIAVKDVNAQVHEGEFIAILGHSGCGKSTVLSMIAGLETATFGGVVIDGREVIGPGEERAIVFQSPCLLPWLTARQNVALARAQMKGRKAAASRASADTFLEMVGVADAGGQLPAHLSLGTQQCVSLARALSTEPRFLLLDEPFSMLDSLTRFELQDTLLRVWEESAFAKATADRSAAAKATADRSAAAKAAADTSETADAPADTSATTIVMVTHDVDEALYLADRLVLMTDGPEATVGDVLTVPFARPRERSSVLAHPDYHRCRRHVIDFLEHHAHQSRASPLDSVLHKRRA